MELNKYVVFTALIVALVVSSYAVPDLHNRKTRAAQNQSHHLIIGTRIPGDKLLMQENIVKSSKWFQIVTVEKSFNTTRYELISQVTAFDQKTNGNGAYASVLSGGPGFQSVRLRFKSQRGHGINFVVQLYGR